MTISISSMNSPQRTACLAKGYTDNNNNHWATLNLCQITLTESLLLTLQPCYHEMADRTASRTDRRTVTMSISYVWPVPLPDNY